MNVVLGNGLIDIPTLLNELNKHQTSSYYYKKATDYQMPSEFTKILLEERAHIEEDRHLSQLPTNEFVGLSDEGIKRLGS